MLKQELRKLREDDMKKQSDRQKRQEFLQKMQVMQSEREAQSRVKVFKERDQALIQLRYESSIRNQLEKEEVARTLSKWAHTGFNSSSANLMNSTFTSGGHSPVANPTITEFQTQLLLTASKRAAEKKKADEASKGGNN
jgi:hypothetical protein